MNSQPLVSVIMAVRNEGHFISRSLGAVLAQDYPHDRLEILVADGMSDDGTRQIVEALVAGAANVTVLENRGKIVATGLNLAIAHAHGDVVVRVDGHTLIAPDYVRQCVAALVRSGADCVGGRMDPSGTTPFGRAVALATSSRFGVGGARFHYSRREEFVDTVYLGAWSRALFEQLGGFDEEQVRNQDDEFHYRLRSRGGRILLCPAIRSRYYNRSSPRQLAKQYFQYGYWKVRVMQKHPRQMRPRQFAPLLLVTGLFTSLAASFVSSIGQYAFLLLGSCYVTATLLASLLTAPNQPWRVRTLLPVVFAILHGAYGCGFLAGLFAFWKQWKIGGPTPQQVMRPLAVPMSAEDAFGPSSSATAPQHHLSPPGTS